MSASRFYQPKREPINQKGGPPIGTISMDLAVSNLVTDYIQNIFYQIWHQILTTTLVLYYMDQTIGYTPTPWLTQLLVLGKGHVNQKSC